MNGSSVSVSLGIVYIVGAGPGDPALITLKGAQALREADIVFYDELLDRRLLDLVSPTCELVYVGKRRGHVSNTQRSINKLMVERAREGMVVVRLKGGDPLIFGRGGEEALHLKQAGVNFEIVPGVSAASGATAYAGIPLTHRGTASAAIIVTGNEDPEAETCSVDWSILAQLDATLAIFMATRTLPAICRTLVRHGRAPTTPAAVIQQGTWSHQKTVEGTLDTLAERAAAASIASPALIVVGEVVTLRNQLMWREHKPLFGRHILVTRSADQAGDLSERLAAAGAQVHNLPLIEISEPDVLQPLDKAICSLSNWHWLLFTSANGVKFFFKRLLDLQSDARVLSHVRIAAVGSKTAQALSECNIRADLIPLEPSQRGLISAFSNLEVEGLRFLFPTSNLSRTELPDALEARGAHVERVIAYQNRVPKVDQTVSQLTREEPIDLIIFTSPSAIHHAYEVLGEQEANALLNQNDIACMGSTTAEAARARGLTVEVQPARSGIPNLVEAICTHYSVL
tara:strand:+ start:1955 stop:3496 length:1542 start_codon:yes stop_codon:yes gene_type:complete